MFITLLISIIGGFIGVILALIFVVGVRIFRSHRTGRKAMKRARETVDMATRATIAESYKMICEAMETREKAPWLLEATVKASLEAMVLIGRTGVLEEFDGIAMADGFVGFSDAEWRGVKKFFEHNKQLTGWDKISA